MKKEMFSTRDLYLATTLISLKFFLENIDYQIEGEKRMPVGYFNFEKTPELIDATQKYRQGQLAIEPKTFITNMRELKAEINNAYKGPHGENESINKSE